MAITSQIPVLYFYSDGIPGLLSINNRIAGEFTDDPKKGLSIPISYDSIIYIGFTPFESANSYDYCLGICKKLVFHDGKLNCDLSTDDGLKIVEWPMNMYQITIKPICIPINKNSDIIKAVCEIKSNLKTDTTTETAAILKNQSYHLIIENNDVMEYDYDIPYNINKINITPSNLAISSRPILLVSGSCTDSEDFLIIIGYDNNKYTMLFNDKGSNIQLTNDIPFKIEILKKISDTANHGELNTYIFNNNSFMLESKKIVWYWGSPQRPQTKMDTVKAFVESVSLDLESEARGYLSDEFLKSHDYKYVKTLMGNFFEWTEPPFSSYNIPSPPVTIGLSQKIKSNYIEETLFRFDLKEQPCAQSNFKICNIIKL